MAFVSVTRLQLRSSRYLIPFIWRTSMSLIQAKRARGNLAARVRRMKDGSFWTLTAWRDEGAMRVFRNSSAHMKAMPKLPEWCDEASIGNWRQETEELPDWIEAHRLMTERGRLSKVKHPSQRQMAGEIPAPVGV